MKIATPTLAALCLAAIAATAPAAGAQGTHGQGQQSRPQGQGQREGNQERRTPWWRDPAVQKELDLSQRQVDKIEKIWSANLPARRERYKQLQALEAETDRLIRENTVDERAFAAKLDQLEALRSEYNKSRMLMIYRMHQALTPEQYRKLSEINDRRRKNGGRR